MVSMAELAKEVHLRVDQEPDSGVPPLTRGGMYELTKAVFDVIRLALENGEEVSVPKFGKFTCELRNARKGVNPSTGKKIDIPAKIVPKFRASSVLKEAAGKNDPDKFAEKLEDKKKSGKKSQGKSSKKKKAGKKKKK